MTHGIKRLYLCKACGAVLHESVPEAAPDAREAAAGIRERYPGLSLWHCRRCGRLVLSHGSMPAERQTEEEEN